MTSPQSADETAVDVVEGYAFRLHQAEELLREGGFVPVGDGTWVPEELA